MNYEQAVHYIHGLGRFGSKLGLERMQLALERLGNPERRLKVIHVAGTNGKGSTSAMLASILGMAGLRTGLYTSPYMDSFTNRFGLDGADICPEDLAALVSALKPLAEEVGLTQFEFITALALYYYAQSKVDALVLEVGLGGRFDATNVVRPALAVITNIGFDHMEVLGDTLGKIAFEKAGIIKQGVPVITAAEGEEALGVIGEVARQREAPLRLFGRDFTATKRTAGLEGQSFAYVGQATSLELNLGLLGPHQLHNAALAVDAALYLKGQGWPVSQLDIQRGLFAAKWPGRFEVMQRSPLVIMDGAHNIHGVNALVKTLQEVLPDKTVLLVTGIMKDKEPHEMLALLAPLVKRFYAAAPDLPRATEPSELAAIARSCALLGEHYDSVALALRQALGEAKPDDVVLVAGSLYTVSEARRALLDK